MANDKIFGSDISRTFNKLNNNLYHLLKVDPVTPLAINNNKNLSCDFVPKTEKYFIPKRKIRPKVKTVRDIRHLFEKEVSSTLSIDIEKQQNVLLRKIRGGSSKDEKTKLLARNMFKSENPISRTSWQMIININPDNYAHSAQYVLWNGKCIQVNGSRGGKSKFIYKYDLGEHKASLLQRYNFKRTNWIKKKDLLKHSLNVKFKPGPLSKKKELDISYQKYNIGNVELVQLPKPGVDILPEYGKPIETSVANFLHNLRDVNGFISDKWAEFAVSALGTNDNGNVVQLNKDSCVTFDLSYKNDQRQLLMRYDVDKPKNVQTQSEKSFDFNTKDEEITKLEVKNIIDEMLVSVEISLMNCNMYSKEDSPREFVTEDISNTFHMQSKDKVKKRGQSELHRLDVTVIRLSDNQEKKEDGVCRKSFCTLGCICDSILSSFHLKTHCGRIECMFECKCDFNKYNLHSCFEDDIIPGLVSLDKENNSKLSKEEQKFHQTVILSGEKSIVLKSQRRNWKAPERYADFYSNMCLKTKKDIKRLLSVVEIKLNCENIEPWCMIHNLYKCFCKGKFTEKLPILVSSDETKTIDSVIDNSKLPLLENIVDLNCISNESTNKGILRPRLRRVINNDDETSTKSLTDEIVILRENDYSHHHSHYTNQDCARVKAFKNRKYSNRFYLNTNRKIAELEENDHGLRKRMLEILKIDENNDIKKPKKDSDLSNVDLPPSPISCQMNQENEILEEIEVDVQNKSTSQKLISDVISTQFTSPTERLLNLKLKAWLEPSLKMYRQRYINGFSKKSLDPPKAGKITLYPWDFIINRYHERKNLFLVTNQKPFRIFMAVDNTNSMFKNCINISSIKNLEHYPVSIKNIITYEIDLLKDQLCILRGLNFCWELVGSVKKVCDRKSSDCENDVSGQSSDVDTQLPQKSTFCMKSPETAVNKTSPSISPENITEQSKWFVMTLENDFSEIQFYNRGFFVKYDSIIKAINVARVSEKTVRLSSQKCNEGNSDPQFGIYAIPNANEYCVFIGPYEKNETLGIETVKSTLQDRKAKTRGVWFITNKVDNLRVIDNPLSFMSQVNLENTQTLNDYSHEETNKEFVSKSGNMSIVSKTEENAKENNKVVKLVKPITITKTNSFYHLTSSGLLKPIVTSPEKQMPKTSLIINKKLSLGFDINSIGSPLQISKLNDNNKCIEEKRNQSSKRPVAEIAPQVKVVEQKMSTKKLEGGMFILKPEEINSRSLANKISLTPVPIENATSTEAYNEIDMDIENFLANSVECSAPTTDVYVISDDEDYCSIKTIKKSWNDVWIICKSVKDIGWISGRKNLNEHLSFEFPGFKYTEFYPQEEAFAKITQVLARKIYIPEHVKLSWSVVETKEELDELNVKKLKQEDLNSDYVLTNKGLMHKFRLAGCSNKKIKTYSKSVTAKKRTTKSTQAIKQEHNKDLEIMKNNINNLDAVSNVLFKEGEQLLNETMLKKEQLSDSFSNMSNDRRQQISDRLRSIISSGNCP